MLYFKKLLIILTQSTKHANFGYEVQSSIKEIACIFLKN